MKNLIYLISTTVLFFLNGLLLANDGPIYYFSGGSFGLMKGEHPSIQMESELVEIFLFEEYYLVTATFDFVNNGDSTTVLIGFPENCNSPFYNDGEDKTKFISNFEFIKSYVDGEEVKLFPQYVNEGNIRKDKFISYWIKTVKFEKGQKRKIVVHYAVSYPYDGRNEFQYNFTGGSWLNKVRHSKLIIYPKVKFTPATPYPDGIKFENGNYVFEKFDWEAEYSFVWSGKLERKTYNTHLLENAIIEFYRYPFHSDNLINLYFYVVKDYSGNIKFSSKIFISFFHSGYIDGGRYNKYKIALNINMKNILFGEYNSIHYFDFSKSFEPKYVSNYKKIPIINGYLCSKNIGCFMFYYVGNINHSVEIIIEKDSIKDEKIFEILDSNVKCLEGLLNDNYGFFSKIFSPGEYKNNLEAYVLQLIFLGREQEGWEYFENNFPLLCSKQSSKDFILETKQKILELRE